MANTTFNGPVRSENGFVDIVKDSLGNVITNMKLEQYTATVTVASGDTTATESAICTSHCCRTVKNESMICELAGITTVVSFAADAPTSKVAPVENVCAITTCPVFFTSDPKVVPVVFEIVPALIGPENVVVAIIIILLVNECYL